MIVRNYDEALAALRRAWITQGVTQQELAQRIGGPRARVAGWLAGRSGDGPRRLFALADALGYDVALVPQRHPGARPTGTGWPA